jgi:hypothetical protein
MYIGVSLLLTMYGAIETAIAATLLAKRNMNVDSCHRGGG